MASYIDLKRGQRITVTPTGGAPTVSCEAAVRDVSEDGLRIDWPRGGGDRLGLRPDDELTLTIHLHGRVYTGRSHVLDVHEFPTASVTIARPTEVQREERREFFRLLTGIDPRYAARTDGDGEELERIDVRILDISGGGVQLRSRRWISVGTHIRLIFSLEDDSMELDVLVLALTVLQPARRRSFYRINAEFVDLGQEVREQIIRFIFRQQLSVRQKRAA